MAQILVQNMQNTLSFSFIIINRVGRNNTVDIMWKMYIVLQSAELRMLQWGQ